MKTEFINANVVKNKDNIKHTQNIKHKAVTSVPSGTGDVEIRKTEQSESAETPYEPKDDMKQAIDDANKRLNMVGRELRYSVHKKTNQLLIKIVDSKSDEVILEIPKEKSLDNLARVLELAGVFVDEKR